MTDIANDSRIVLTLDAGGTNLVFSAIQGNQEIVKPVHYPTHAHQLDKLLNSLLMGFRQVQSQIPAKASAISFAFPGPADYPKGIIGNLPNFEAFTHGVALGPMLEEAFNLPVFIHNDGNLFAYGEALCGFLPELNKSIVVKGGIKQYKNLIGLTLGTGFGCGAVINNKLLAGDNSSDTGIHNTLNKFDLQWNAEESVSTRAIQRVYTDFSKDSTAISLMPESIYRIAKEEASGHKEAAKEAFRQFGEGLGSSIANILTLLDSNVVIGGGITAAWDLFAPAMFNEIHRPYKSPAGKQYPRLDFRVYNLQNPKELTEFSLGKVKEIAVPFSHKTVAYDDLPRVGIGVSKLGASKAIALGAYAIALQNLDSL